MMEIIEEFKGFKKLHNLSQNYVANSLKVSEAQLSQFLNNKYQGDVEKLKTNLKKFMQNFSEKILLMQDNQNDFLELSYTKEALFYLYESVASNEMMTLTGQAGTGKTTLVEHFMKNNPNSIFIRARESTTTKILFKKICGELRISHSTSIDEMITDIIDELKKGDFIIIIDESEHLKYTGLEGLRNIWDETQTPIVLVGTDILIDNLLGKDSKYKQLYSRIGTNHRIKGITKNDTLEVFHNIGIDLDNVILEHIYKSTRGNFRITIKILKKIKRLMNVAKCEDVNIDIAKKAIGMVILG